MAQVCCGTKLSVFRITVDLQQVSLAAKMGEEKKRERLVILGSLDCWLDRILYSRHPFTKNHYPIIRLERKMIQQSKALRCSLTMADSSFDETVDNKPVIFRMEPMLDSS